MPTIRPGDTLIITELWAAAAAYKLGFELEVMGYQIDKEIWVSWQTFINYWRPFHFVKARIKATETGPNAAERFLPMAGDDCKFKFNSGCLTVEEEWKWVKRSNERFGFLVKNYFLWFQRIVERPHNGEMVPFPTYKIEGQL